MSSQDYSPAPYPFYTENGEAEVYAIPEARPRERYWLYCLLFAATFLTATVTGAMRLEGPSLDMSINSILSCG